jgi:hypothetical protein
MMRTDVATEGRPRLDRTRYLDSREPAPVEDEPVLEAAGRRVAPGAVRAEDLAEGVDLR